MSDRADQPVDRWLAEERLTHLILGAFFRVYNQLGFGFLEHVYAAALEREWLRLGRRVSREHWVRIHYDGVELCQQRLDFVVEERVVVEVGLLFHFGPEAKFYRLYSPNSKKPHQADPKQSD